MKDTDPTISYTLEIQPTLTRVLTTGFYLPHDINDFGQIVGDFTLRGPSTAFLYDAGVVHTDIVPATFEFSALGGINDVGQLAGSVLTQGGVREAILISHGALQTLTYPGSTATEALGINNRGQVVGDYVNASGTHGFAGKPGHLRPVDVPQASQTMAYAINDWGQIAGSYQDAAGHKHGFLDSNGHDASIDVPGAQQTSVTGINDWDQLVGSYVDSAGQTHGFVLTGGQFQTLDQSGAFLTSASGINNLGQIVGYAESNGSAGMPPQAQVWVAKPAFIHDAGNQHTGNHNMGSSGTATADTGASGTELPGAADVAALLRGIAETDSALPDLAAWRTNLTSGAMQAAIAPLEAAVTGIFGQQDWAGLPGAQAWSLAMQHTGNG